MSWSAAQYQKYENERNRPVLDLLAHIPDIGVKRAMDLGCGSGNSTQMLQERCPAALVFGLDSSADMIAAATRRLPQIRFQLGDIAGWQAESSFDVILANAVLQWLPDHERLMPRLMKSLSPGGCLALQMPDNLEEPAHRLMREIALDGPWAGRLVSAMEARAQLLSADQYYRILSRDGANVDIWRTIYYHPLAGGADAVVEWFKGSGLRPFLDPLSEDERTGFLARYKAAVGAAYPIQADGILLLPFPRLFMIVRRASA